MRAFVVKVGQIMKRIVHTIQAEDTLDTAAKHIANGNISLLPVVDKVWVEDSHIPNKAIEDIGFLPIIEEDVLVGIITTRDIVARAIANDMNPKNTPVSDIMTTEFACCRESDDVVDALEIMERRKVRRLFALDQENRVVGLVSRHDIWSSRNGVVNRD